MAEVPITVAVTRTVKPGSEAAFEKALQAFVRRSLETQGQLGVLVLRPAADGGSREYGILRRFASPDDLEAFYGSELYSDWEREVAHLTAGEPRCERVSGLEAWFTAPGRAIVPPPRWKMALITLVGVYPIALAAPPLLLPFVAGWPTWADALARSGVMVATLTWVVMPPLARLFRPWLSARKGTDR